MKKRAIVLGVLASALLANTAIAGCGGKGGDYVQHRLEHMQRKLDLTDAQKTALESVMSAHQEQMKAIHDSFQAQIRAQLSPDQAEKFDAMKERKGRHGKRRWWGKGGGSCANDES